MDMNADKALNLPMNRCVDDSNVAIDYGAIFKGVNIGGIDRQGVSQVSCSKSITHCRKLRKRITIDLKSVELTLILVLSYYETEQNILKKANCATVIQTLQ